jgi:D-beta-D-heptose 7-phosphate kinase / D-beta-D-heptose 1-phosphate adenosyltransferase
VTTHLIPLLDKLAGHKVLCVGDVMLDRYIYGQVERVSPEAPIPVIRIEKESVTLGGAGNVAHNIATLGGTVELLGVIHKNDYPGKELRKQIKLLRGIKSLLLEVTDPTRPTTFKTRYTADGQQLLRVDHESVKPITEKQESDIIARAKEAMTGCKIVLLSDYAKGVLTPKVVREIIRAAKKKGAKVIIDPKGYDFSHYEGAMLLTPNRKELTEATGIVIQNIRDAKRAAEKLIKKHRLQGVLAKLGSQGVYLVMKGKRPLHFRTHAREVFDLSGAGDTVAATLALALAGGLTPPQAAELANLAGSVVVGKIGTATVSREELGR